MSSSEFKARALYDFVAEGSNELSFKTNDILTITSNSAGNGWWFAKNSFGEIGVIPENYVQALADPPEPTEPPPSFSTFSNNYPNLDTFNGNGARSAYQPQPPSYDQHSPMYPQPNYMNNNNWQTSDTTSWQASAPTMNATGRQSSKRDTDSDDSFSDSEYPTPSPSSAQIMNTNPLSKHASVKRTNTVPGTSIMSNQPRTSIAASAAAENTKGPPRARFFDKHGLDSYLLNGSKAKSDEHVEITFDERQGGVCWSPNPGIPPFTCKVEEPSKGTKLGGLKAYMEYKIQPQVPGCRPVGRRYKQFDWLHEQLVNKFRFVCIPPLPGKQIAGRFEQEFIEERRRQLELWLNRICSHPVLCASYAVQHFITCDLSDKSRKDWKTGKRRVEKDDLREASWLQCVTVVNSGLSDPQLISQIDTFAQQQPNLESQMKNLSQGLAKYIERHTEVYEKDLQRISDVFSKVHLAVQVDTTTPGNKDLSTSIHKISGSYSGVAELYKTKGSEGLRDLNERIQEYIGLLACFPSILNIQRSASDFMKTLQQRGVTDFSQAVHRNYVLNHVVLAEINFFQREKVDDFSNYFKTFVDEQIKFYEEITSQLRDAAATFK